MAQLKITLPDGLRAKLDAATAQSGYRLAEEIRKRLERTFAEDAMDEPTRKFLDGVKLMPAEIERETGAAWYAHAGAHAVFRQSILSRLGRLKPDGDLTFGERPHQAIPGAHDPQEMGVWIEYSLWDDPDFTHSRARAALEESYREIVKFHRENEQKEKRS